MTLKMLLFRYVTFAVIATIANLLTQRFVLWSHSAIIEKYSMPFVFSSAVAAGTVIGLAIKYFLDKRWIFNDLSSGVRAHGKQFTLYALMGVVTTIIFWGTETTFWIVWKTDVMRELGAVIGLSIGYFIKFNLDRRFVFKNATYKSLA